MSAHTTLRRLGVFAKYWQPGKVKTRIAAQIGPAKAAEVYRLWLTLLLSRVVEVGDEHVLAAWPPDQLHSFEQLAGHPWQIRCQAEGDLGARMKAFFRGTAGRSSPPPHNPRPPSHPVLSCTVLIGSDSPTLPTNRVRDAFEALERVPLVFGPAVDGGYYLIGLRDDVAPDLHDLLFDDLPWSDSSLWQVTRGRLDSEGVSYKTLAPWYDVDEWSDLLRLQNELRTRPPDSDWGQLATALNSILRGELLPSEQLP